MTENRPYPGDVAHNLQLLREQYGGDNFDADAVMRYGAFVGSVIECHESLPRAMDHGRNRISEAAGNNRSLSSGTVILADTMSRSKGRFTRQWFAPPGGVWGCMIHANTLLPESRRFIPFATGLACCQAVRDLGVDKATLRWVNDVLFEGRKLAGFLVEGFTERIHNEEFTLVGFGVNINNCEFPPELADSSIALSQIVGRDVDLSRFTALFLARLAWNFGLLYYEEAKALGGEAFSGRSGAHLLLENWRGCSDTLGRKVVYGFDVVEKPQYRAEVLRLDEDGGLVMRLEDGYQKTEYSGEVRYLDPC